MSSCGLWWPRYLCCATLSVGGFLSGSPITAQSRDCILVPCCSAQIIIIIIIFFTLLTLFVTFAYFLLLPQRKLNARQLPCSLSLSPSLALPRNSSAMAAEKPSNKWSSSDGYPSWNCSRSGSPDHTGSERKCLVMMGTDDEQLIMDAETGGGGVVPEVGGKRSRKGAAKNGKGASSNSEQGCGDLEQAHILTERERRKKMRNMFSGLHALLPQLPPKADKCAIVDEALKYIKTLQQNIQMLEKQKLEKLQGAAAPIVDYEPSVITSLTQTQESREAFLASRGPNMEFPVPIPGSSFSIFPPTTCFQTWSSPNVVMSMCGDDAHISVCSARKSGLLNTIFYILEKHNLDVVSAHISSDFHGSTYMIHAHAGGRSHRYPEALSVEDTFKLAAGEMNLWLLQSGNWSI